VGLVINPRIALGWLQQATVKCWYLATKRVPPAGLDITKCRSIEVGFQAGWHRGFCRTPEWIDSLSMYDPRGLHDFKIWLYHQIFVGWTPLFGRYLNLSDNFRARLLLAFHEFGFHWHPQRPQGRSHGAIGRCPFYGDVECIVIIESCLCDIFSIALFMNVEYCPHQTVQLHHESQQNFRFWKKASFESRQDGCRSSHSSLDRGTVIFLLVRLRNDHPILNRSSSVIMSPVHVVWI